MARKISLFFLLLLTGTFLAWSGTGPSNRGEARAAGDDAGVPVDQLPSVMRRSGSRPSRGLDRPPATDNVTPAAQSEDVPRATFTPPPPTQPTTQPAPSGVDASQLPTVLRRKPKGSAAPAENVPPPATETTEPASEPETAPSVRPSAPLPRPFGNNNSSRAAAPAREAAREPAPKAPANGVLLQGGTPGLRVEAAGPRTIRRGVEGKYVIHVVSTADMAFQDVEIRVSLPNSVALSGSEPTSGETKRVEESEEFGLVVWTLPRVEARAREQLVLHLVPHQDRAFELGLDWVCRSARQLATIDVQQPQLELSMSGPKEARYGEALNYLVTVSNPGSGDAENVSVKLTAGQNAPESVNVGLVPAGQQKQIEVQLAANQPGELKLVAEAAGDGDLRAEGFAEIQVRRAELQAQLTGPKTTYAGVPVLYQLRLTNAGNAAADDVTATLSLPPGVRVDSATEGARQTGNSLAWKVASLGANAERVFEVKCELSTTGENKIDARIASADGLTAAANAVTTIEALADLKLNVQEPKGPRQVGDELVYEVVIGNRGTKAAEEISVVIQFADGIEPLNAEGSPAEVVDGQVVFEPIARLAAGQQVTLRVKAKAEKVGGQRFRVEVQCPASETQLVSEGTTRVFGGSAAETAARPSTTRR